jgi:deoxyribodipyrimidine photo-lyase
LARARERHLRVAVVFCFERRLLAGRHSSPNRNAYLLACLRELDHRLKERGGRLLYRSGDPAREIPRLVQQLGAPVVYANEDHTPNARRRDAAVANALRDAASELVLCGGIACVDLASIETTGGGAYRVFTPFHRAWTDAPRRPVEPAPRRIRDAKRVPKGRPPSLRELEIGVRERRIAAQMNPGELAARRRLAASVRRASAYRREHDLMAADGTSRLSPALHFGTISALEMESRLRARRSPGASAMRRQLAWRDFFLALIRAYPENRGLEHQGRFRGFQWRSDPLELESWKQGRTGVPLVDAGMRQLLATGWMHNRARMVAGSFLTKQLLCDWRDGEAHFMRLLLDGDESQNNGNWQWVASVGADAAPYFRVLSPVRQQQRFDPEGIYVRRWVPELRRLPERWLAEPWKAPKGVQRSAGCVIGDDYPEPVVDLKRGRDHALARFRAHAQRRGGDIAPRT